MAAFQGFDKRIAVVAGGASGIGLSLLLELVQMGLQVAVCDVDAAGLEAAVHQARKIRPGAGQPGHSGGGERRHLEGGFRPGRASH